jgi:hypothetical protein
VGKLLDSIARSGAVEQARKAHTEHPTGWEPGASWNAASGRGTITARTARQTPEWEALLVEWGFDPATHEIVEDTIQFRTWDAAIGEGNVQRFKYYRAEIRIKRPGVDLDAEKLIADIRAAKSKPPRDAHPSSDAGVALCIALADWQIGQRGTEESVRRILALAAAIPARAAELRRAGVRIDEIVLLGLGDLVEGCEGWYAAQTFTVELNEREQRAVARRLLAKIITAALEAAPRVRVAVIGGNHGEARRNGKSYTDAADNADVEVAEVLADAYAGSADAERITFIIPRHELALTIDVGGTIIGITHGHLAKRGAGAANKVEQWWKGQALGMRPVADATILVSGHYHHLSITQHGPRWAMQAPAMCGPSEWYADATGLGESAPGTLTFTVGPTGWDHLRIIATRPTPAGDALAAPGS